MAMMERPFAGKLADGGKYWEYKKRILTGIMATTAVIMSGCGNQEQLMSSSDIASMGVIAYDEQNVTDEIDITTATDTTTSTDTSNDNYQVWSDQKIVFMMWIASYDEPYSNGYFIDGKGTKHIYKRSGVMPMYPVEDEYAYLLEHYDEFETMAYFDDDTLKKCAECLYQVNANAEIRTEGKAIADAPEKKLYGVRMIDGNEEFVFLGSEPGIVKRLDDAASDQIFALFGDKWYLQ